MCRAHWKRWHKTGDVMASEPIRSLEVSRQRFWANIDSSAGPDECWPWTSPRRKKAGYGEVQLNGTTMTAARAVYILTTGERPPVVRHTCDNPPCCNPRHLLPGTHRDNMRDAAERGRSSRGECHAGAILTASDVRQIRAAIGAGESQPAVARRYGVSRGAISSIVQGRTWKHVA